MKIIYFFISIIFFSSVSLVKGQIIDPELLIKNAFLTENIMKSDSFNVSIEDYYSSFNFKLKEIGSDDLYSNFVQYFVLDSFNVLNNQIVEESYLKDSVYIIAMNKERLYRLKGFSYNDFPFLLKLYLDQPSDYSVKEILYRLNRLCNNKGNINVDFECLYHAFRSKEINYDIYPCLESFVHSSNALSVVMGYNGKICVKKGGEPIGYRGKKNKKNKYRQQY